MPLFEYQCDSCGVSFERLVFSSDKGDIDCPQCQSLKVHRLLSGFSYKSSGKYSSSKGSSCSSCTASTCSGCSSS